MYELSSYHILLTALGAAIILAYWLPRFVSGREPAASALLIGLGLLIFGWLPGMPAAISPITAPKPWEVVSELCVVVGLFGVGLRIDRLTNRARWVPTWRLLAIAMPLTILAIAAIGWQLAGMTLAGALLLGAVLAPTDPVLAGDVQVGPPTEGGEHPVRFTLTTEAGATELVEGYGFIAAFVAGLTLRRSESHHAFHTRLHDFTESIEHALTAVLLIGLGAALPALLPALDWREAAIGLVLIFLVRPLVGWASLHGTLLKGRRRLAVAAYGVRGIGSIYYLAYAGSHMDLVNKEQLWAIIAFTIVVSTVVHGFTAGLAVEAATGQKQSEPTA